MHCGVVIIEADTKEEFGALLIGQKHSRNIFSRNFKIDTPWRNYHIRSSQYAIIWDALIKLAISNGSGEPAHISESMEIEDDSEQMLDL